MTYFFIAGEASGDLHASHLIEAIKQNDAQASFAGLGGDKMRAAGCRLYQNYREMAFMGFVAVLANLNKVRRNFIIAHRALLNEQPDVLVLIDYPSFNLKMAKFCRKHLPKTKIYYYIPPKIWAWKSWRIREIAKLCDEVLCIFPFEPAYYRLHSQVYRDNPNRCTYVGNPTAEEVALYQNFQSPKQASESTEDTAEPIENKDILVILPGSRESEVRHCLPKMLEASRLAIRFGDSEKEKGLHIVVTAAPNIEDSFYTPFLRPGEILTRNTYEAISSARVAVVNSGTATLETALLGTPQVAVYHLSCNWIVSLLRPLVQPILFKIPFFTLVNIIANREVIKELVANDFTVTNMEWEIRRLLVDDMYRKYVLEGYSSLRSLLGTKKAASTAADILAPQTPTYPSPITEELPTTIVEEPTTTITEEPITTITEEPITNNDTPIVEETPIEEEQAPLAGLHTQPDTEEHVGHHTEDDSTSDVPQVESVKEKKQRKVRETHKKAKLTTDDSMPTDSVKGGLQMEIPYI